MRLTPRRGIHVRSAASYFAVHNWWHRALYHLELGEIDQVSALYDGHIRGIRSTEWLDEAIDMTTTAGSDRRAT